MAKHEDGKLNKLLAQLPEGAVVDAAWLSERGYSTSLRSQYVSAGWLEQPARRLYRRPRGTLSWEQVVISLQTVLDFPVLVGGRTALELQGFAHYLPAHIREVHLYADKPLPGWIDHLRLGVDFRKHNSHRLFANQPITLAPTNLTSDTRALQAASNDPIHGSVKRLPWGHWEWPLTVSTPERAFLEMLDELPKHESFHQVDKLMEGLATLSPRRLAKLLHDCKSVKVKRLFFFFAFRHRHRWLLQLDPEDFDLGSGKRMLAPGGKLDKRFNITAPGDLDGQP
ncbi:type IV toxin-antitoxin system AbiEi family antitoxin domain-containing protein [Phenylobacterium sp.]|uniref:type IV toxin-antitoxin system AbiEi family antitoxin domain-containing protein n=1 Tax=Phenylobacterium sp. TaxID=1871053 RepID=UPI0025E32AE3|nr:type IV toxin-antitoxin system AbiEi family antitoxin domain-containing protein [Phenylobacterium sp.]MBX3484795.1 type IV toxin-antitoxin system AbiEi family antitoxin domain-containing protein [Phenylobacterium sp.]